MSFDEASTVSGDPLARIFDDEDYSPREAREIIIGHAATNRLLLGSFTERAKGVTRIIKRPSCDKEGTQRL